MRWLASIKSYNIEEMNYFHLKINTVTPDDLAMTEAKVSVGIALS